MTDVQAGPTTDVQANFEVIRQWNRSSQDGFPRDDLAAPDYIAHTPEGDYHGLEEYRRAMREAMQPFASAEAGIDELIGQGDLVAERWWIRATTHDGGMQLMHGITMHRLSNGRILENWAVLQLDS
jgi:hypothetical protein